MSWFQDFLSLGEDDEERQQRLLHEQQEEQGSNKRLVKAVAEDIEHEVCNKFMYQTKKEGGFFFCALFFVLRIGTLCVYSF
eukprot:m.72457 g.72457  ORF g.72457 m.72457 type:complete len:81 (+) comp11737_c0_seq13:124-366(+)